MEFCFQIFVGTLDCHDSAVEQGLHYTCGGGETRSSDCPQKAFELNFRGWGSLVLTWSMLSGGNHRTTWWVLLHSTWLYYPTVRPENVIKWEQCILWVHMLPPHKTASTRLSPLHLTWDEGPQKTKRKQNKEHRIIETGLQEAAAGAVDAPPGRVIGNRSPPPQQVRVPFCHSSSDPDSGLKATCCRSSHGWRTAWIMQATQPPATRHWIKCSLR